LALAKKDTQIAILIGGIISMAIIIAATSVQSSKIENAADLALSLEPLFGKAAKWVLGLGLFAAGITSAITAPMAAAYVLKGCFNWQDGLKSTKFRLTWMIVLFIGILFSSIGLKPIQIITFAQIANGLLLPFIAGFLLWAMNQSKVLGKYVNTARQNIIGIIIVIIAIGLGLKSIYKVISPLFHG
jgi:Mn2+/Fe2+ NRAMP family transporter